MTFSNRTYYKEYYLSASLFDTVVKIVNWSASNSTTPEKGNSQFVAKLPIIEYQSFVPISLFRLSIGLLK